jgi:hypothetical protein
MIKFVFGKAVGKIGPVNEIKYLPEIRFKSHFFRQPSFSRINDVFSRQGMAAAGIRPQAAAVILGQRSLLQQHFTFTVKDKNAEGPVQVRFPVRFYFLHGAYRLIPFIN